MLSLPSLLGEKMLSPDESRLKNPSFRLGLLLLIGPKLSVLFFGVSSDSRQFLGSSSSVDVELSSVLVYASSVVSFSF